MQEQERPVPVPVPVPELRMPVQEPRQLRELCRPALPQQGQAAAAPDLAAQVRPLGSESS